MDKSERIFTKKDVLIFFIISILCSIVFVFGLCEEYTRIEDIIRRGVFSTIFFIVPVLAVILNLIFNIANIESQKIIKITKIIFYPIVFLLMFLEGALTIFLIP